MELIQEFKGETKSNKIIDNCYHIYKELFTKQFPEYFQKNHSKMFSLVTITEDNEIKDIGMSKVDDLLVDNWGEFFGALLGGTSATMKNNGGSSKTVNVYGSAQTRLFSITNNGAVGTKIRVGTGTTPATRQDFAIQSAFIGSPENTFQPTGEGAWSTGLGQISIPMQLVINGVGGALSETVLFGNWATISPVENQQYCISRDNISPVVNVIVGETVNIDYTMVFT